MPNVVWFTCGDDNHWCDLLNLDLDTVGDAVGVYIIWRSGGTENPATVRVGQGDIAARLRNHRTDDAVLQHAADGRLYVTWASVGLFFRDGVERYLGNQLQPLVGEAFPDVAPIQVNLPW